MALRITHNKIKKKVKENLKGKYDDSFIDKTCDLIWKNEGIGRLVRENYAKFSIFKLFTFSNIKYKKKSYKKL